VIAQSKRDRALLDVLFGCGLRRREAVELDVARIQPREDHCAIVDLVGKGQPIRPVPVPDWVQAAIDSWPVSAGVSEGRLFSGCVCRAGKTRGTS
jgi:site-specific recombinase XerC